MSQVHEYGHLLLCAHWGQRLAADLIADDIVVDERSLYRFVALYIGEDGERQAVELAAIRIALDAFPALLRPEFIEGVRPFGGILVILPHRIGPPLGLGIRRIGDGGAALQTGGDCRQAEVLHGQGMSMADAIRQLGISEVTYYRWRKEYGGMSGGQLRRLKELEKENERLRRAVSDLMLDKQILAEAARAARSTRPRWRVAPDAPCMGTA